jgi:hypothetical protein
VNVSKLKPKRREFKKRVRVNQWFYFPLSAMDFPLFAWYQQAGRWQKAVESGKYIDISGKWSRYFTLTLKKHQISYYKGLFTHPISEHDFAIS